MHALPTLRPTVRDWRFEDTPEVDTRRLRPGVELVVSRFGSGEPRDFRYAEPADVFAIAFHLRGGARFAMTGCEFTTRPLDVWAGGSPRGDVSAFALPREGFCTVSVRFAPDAALALLDGTGPRGESLARLVQRSAHAATAAHLGSLRPEETALVHAIVDAPYAGRLRDLQRESALLGLLASRLGAPDPAPSAHRRRRAADDRRLDAARRLLEERLADPPSLLELARAVGTNDFALKRGFKQRYGVTVFGWVRRRRMERAHAELLAGASVQAAAAAVGYACPRCFASAFRREFGRLPSAVAETPPRDGRRSA